jgi:hypothetical protein
MGWVAKHPLAVASRRVYAFSKVCFPALERWSSFPRRLFLFVVIRPHDFVVVCFYRECRPMLLVFCVRVTTLHSVRVLHREQVFQELPVLFRKCNLRMELRVNIYLHVNLQLPRALDSLGSKISIAHLSNYTYILRHISVFFAKRAIKYAVIMDNNDGNLSNGGVLLVKSETEHRAQATTKPENGTHIGYPQAISKVSRGVILVSLWGGRPVVVRWLPSGCRTLSTAPPCILRLTCFNRGMEIQYTQGMVASARITRSQLYLQS